MKKLLFRIEAIIGDRHDAPDSLQDDEIRQWLLNMQKQDILKVETETEYWEDIPTQLFDLIKNNIKDENFEYTMTQGRLWLKMEIPLEAESDEK